jgi:hypothetical protein
VETAMERYVLHEGISDVDARRSEPAAIDGVSLPHFFSSSQSRYMLRASRHVNVCHGTTSNAGLNHVCVYTSAWKV